MITNPSITDVKKFINHAGSSLFNFRYFKSRNVHAAIKRHLVTLLDFENDNPVSYGHLDHEGNKTWLGICVAEGFVGKGYGYKMMLTLLSKADSLGVNSVWLSVDDNNVVARHLYEKTGFVLQYKKGDVIFYKKEM